MRSNRQPVLDRNSRARRLTRSLHVHAGARPSPARRTSWFLVGLVVLLTGLHATAAQTPAAVPPTTPVTRQASAGVLKSVFISDPTFGKDPFFPESKRRLKDLPLLPLPSTNKVDGSVVLSEGGFEKFTLKGISHSGNRKLAMINFYTFAEGEEQEVKVDNQTITVKCELIKERSAVIRIKDRTKELTLRSGVY